MIMLEQLNIIEAAGTAPAGFDDAWLHVLIEAKTLAYADRMAHAVDPAFGSTPMNRLLSNSWAK